MANKQDRGNGVSAGTSVGETLDKSRRLDFDHVDLVLRARSIEPVWQAHCEKMKEYGFDRLIYGLNRFRTHGEFGDLSDWIVLTNHDPDYIELFFGKALYFHAPMAVWAARNTGVCSWQWAQDRRAAGETSAEENRVLDLNEKMGVVAGYSISFEAVFERSTAGIGLCARKGLSQADVDEVWQEKGGEIILLNNLMNLKISTLPYTRLHKPLTRRQREVLQWVADGKTVQDIATIMGLNPATVEKHLRLVRERLNAETTAQAVMKASMQNQFFVIEGLHSDNLHSEALAKAEKMTFG